jgi:WD40 repeat protein
MHRAAAFGFALILARAAYAQPVPGPYPDQPYFTLDTGGPGGMVKRVAFTPDGKYLLLTGNDKTLRIWDLTTCETVRVIRPPIGPADRGKLYALAVSHDGKRAAIGGVTISPTNKSVLVYVVGLESGHIELALDGQGGAIVALDFSPDDKHVAASGHDGVVRVYNAGSGRQELAFKAHDSAVNRIVFAPDGRRLVTVGYDGAARIWTFPGGKQVAEARAGDAPARWAAWSPDGSTLAVSARGASVSLFDPNGQLRKTIVGLPKTISSVTFTPDGRELLIAGSRIPGVAMVDVTTGKIRMPELLHENVVQFGAVSPDGKLAATTGGHDHETYVWRTADFKIVQEIAGKARVPRNIGWATDGKSIRWNHIIRATDPLVVREGGRAFDLERFQFVDALEDDQYRLFVHERAGSVLRANQTRTELTITSRDQNPKTLKMPAGFGPIRGYCWLNDGRIVVGTAYALGLFDAETGKLMRRFLAHSDEVRGVSPSPCGRYFVSNAADMTMRIWNPEEPRPVLSFFFAEPEWIAWTEEGIYASSVNGERLMGWQVNNGMLQAGSFYPAVQFRKSLYHPDVIREVLPSSSPALALAKLNKQPILSVTEVLPPVVTITSPAGLGTVPVKQSRFVVEAVARSRGHHPVTALRLLVNGRPYQGHAALKKVEKPALGDAVRASWNVDLEPGLYQLAVVAEAGVSRAVSRMVEVSIGGERRTPNLYALAIGISNYPGNLRLDFAADDAEALCEALSKSCKGAFDRIDVKLVRDRQATKVAVEDSLDWLAAKMTAQDVGILFFSGHGLRDTNGTFYLIPVDLDLNNLAETCIAGDVLKKKLGEIPGRLIAVLDACHSGAAGERPRPQVPPADDLVRDLVSEDYGVIVMSSSHGREQSLENAKLGGGYFTHALLEGLSGKADANQDGVVYLGELDVFAARRVRQLTFGTQNPFTARPATVYSFPLAKD